MPTKYSGRNGLSSFLIAQELLVLMDSICTSITTSTLLKKLSERVLISLADHPGIAREWQRSVFLPVKSEPHICWGTETEEISACIRLYLWFPFFFGVCVYISYIRIYMCVCIIYICTYIYIVYIYILMDMFWEKYIALGGFTVLTPPFSWLAPVTYKMYCYTCCM